MKILVTGSSTQTGSLAVRALLREGYAVRCLVRGESGQRFLPNAGEQFVCGDLEDTASLLVALRGVEAVVNIADIRFAPAVIAACDRAGVRRAIFLSSTRRYTKFPSPSARKVCDGEAAIEAGPLDYTILRPSMIYGSARDNNVSRLIGHLRRRTIFPLVGGGRNLVQPVFVLDVVAALTESLQRPAAIRRAYTLAGPEPISYRRMVESIAVALGRTVKILPIPYGPALLAARLYGALVRHPRLTVEQVRRFGEDRSFDIAAARRDLNFAPIRFSQGIARQVAGEIDAAWAEPSKDR